MSASLSNEQIEDRYFLLGRMEILTILNDLIHRREPVTIYFNGGKDFILTLLLEARPEALIFDLGGDLRSNRLLGQAASCVFIGLPDGIRVQFNGVEPQLFDWGDTEAFWVPLPDRVIRMQRRETYRNLVPVVNAPSITLYDANSVPIGPWKVHDLSIGGVGVTVSGVPRVKAGDPISHLKITLSDKKSVICKGVIRHCSPLEKKGAGRYRVGIEFIDLPHGMEVDIQRFIIKIESERRKLLGLK